MSWIFADGLKNGMKNPYAWGIAAVGVGAPVLLMDQLNHNGKPSPWYVNGAIFGVPAAVVGGGLGMIVDGLSNEGGGGSFGAAIWGAVAFGAAGIVAGALAGKLDQQI
jgi:hypothetical protein